MDKEGIPRYKQSPRPNQPQEHALQAKHFDFAVSESLSKEDNLVTVKKKGLIARILFAIKKKILMCLF